MKEIKKLADPEIRVIEKVKNLLNEEQKLLKKGLNEEIKNAKLSYAEINEVLYLIDREQHYLANHRR
ncbi:hypothetical protein [Staphylococcus agnetis]|nr:hypothetical protein [Staphylococcus agnetis]KFE40773.1 hypothetical protein SAGN_11372 [Staphylococcus agnetis]KFE41933.1 hypothetical protein SAGN_05910 [Staphylococcus agnetis]MBY7664005.1 hypothetical protein [Staphylococcus agnetis]NJH66023.1 hypothetical protein [Staphylococcus agnetis]NJH87360.1 hypothetical protein [Staphylococcus agnetis]